MKTYSLLLRSLEPRLSRQELEEISVGIPSVARADCAWIANDWFGIVAQGLSMEDANLFRAGLLRKGVESDVVADVEIPALHHDFRCNRIDLMDSEISLTTAMNRKQVRQRGDLVFISAGFLEKERPVTVREWDTEVRGTRVTYMVPVLKETRGFESKAFFRVDLFFGTDPHRISLEMGKDTLFFYGDRPIRMKNLTELTVLMVDLQSLLPTDRMNRSLREINLESAYPTMHAYEEELRWSFHKLGATG